MNSKIFKNMKKIFLSMCVFALIFTSCSNDQNEAFNEQSKIDMSDFYVQTEDVTNGSLTGKSINGASRCASMQVLNRQLQENPGLYQKMYDIEYQTRSFIAAKGKPPGVGGGNGGNDGGGDADVDVEIVPDNLGNSQGIINIRVYVHVIYPDALSNQANTIPDSQIQDQIDVLNADFRNPNIDLLHLFADADETNFDNDATDAGFSFSLAGIIRHDDLKSSWGTNNSVKFEYPPIYPETYLNIWVCNIGGGILGYAQFPGGNPDTDGIVIGGDYFGNTGGVYGLGRTATHEVGHYLNLRHIWGDGRCKRDDFVIDTPVSDRPNYGCPSFPTVHCKTTDMTMNYMDYTYDACMYMFSDGQRNRMRAIFAVDGARESMLPLP